MLVDTHYKQKHQETPTQTKSTYFDFVIIFFFTKYLKLCFWLPYLQVNDAN